MKNRFLAPVMIALLTACAHVPEQQLADSDKTVISVNVTKNSSIQRPVVAEPSPDSARDKVRSSRERVAHARALADKRQFVEAREELQALYSERSDDPEVVRALAGVSMYLDRRAEGEMYFERYHHLMSNKKGYLPGQMMLVLARLCRERDDIEASRKWLAQVDPNETESYFLAQIQSSMLLAKEGNTESALALVDSLEPKTPADLLQIVLVKADFLRQSGYLQEAFAVLAEGMPHVPPEAELFNSYASVANQIGRFDVAESAARAAMAHAPNDYAAYNNLGFWLAERNVRLEEALQLASRALEISPDNPYAMDTMGYVQYRRGDLGAAETQLRRVYSFHPHPQVVLHLAEVLLQKGEREEVQKLLYEASANAEAKGLLNDILRNKIEGLRSRL